MSSGRTVAALASLCLALVSGAHGQEQGAQAIGTIGDWSVRCSGAGTSAAVCFLNQRLERSADGGLVAEIVADPTFLAARVPAGADLAVPMTAAIGGAVREFAWQSCTAQLCEALLPLDTAAIAAIEQGATLNYVGSGGAAVSVPLPVAGLGQGLGLLAEAAVRGAEALPQPKPSSAPIQRIRVRDVVFTDSGYLTREELAAAAAPYVGRRVTIADLAGLIAAVNALYTEKGISLAQAILTGVDPRGGLVRVELFEARIGSVGYVTQAMSDDYLAFRLGLEPGMLADNRLIEERLNRLALTDVVTAAATFAPGAERGSTDLTLTFEEPAPYWWYAGLDNLGSAPTGLARVTVGGGIRSLTGWNDPLAADLVLTEGSAAGVVSYARVVHPSGTRLAISLDASGSKTLTAPEVTDRVAGVLLSLTQPVILEAGRRWDVGGALLGFAETGTVIRLPLVDQRGAGVRLTSAVSFGGQGWALSSGQSFTVVRWADAITAEPGLTFLGAGGTVTGAVALGEIFAFSVEAAGQVALGGGRAPARHQFGVSGPAGVRGYGSELSKGDTGFYARAQLGWSKPIVLGPLGLTPFVFADAGRAYDAAFIPQDLLASVGMGTGIALTEHLSGEVFVAKPLLSANGFDATGKYDIRASLIASF